MKTTEYLFDEPREFFEPETTALATKRIKAARKLMKRISSKKDNPKLSTAELDALATRYEAAEDAVAWWTELLRGK